MKQYAAFRYQSFHINYIKFVIVPHTWFMQNGLEGHTLHCLQPQESIKSSSFTC